MTEWVQSNKVSFTCTAIDNLPLLNYAKNLPCHGFLKYTELPTTMGSYCYLKIDDDYIFKLFPLLKDPNIQKPNYFSPDNDSGAHITLVYPDEPHSDDIKEDIKHHRIASSFPFEITGLIKVSTSNKTFFALTVLATELQRLRQQHGLTERLNFKGLFVPFHITIATAL